MVDIEGMAASGAMEDTDTMDIISQLTMSCDCTSLALNFRLTSASYRRRVIQNR